MPHDRLERRSLAMHQAMANKLQAQPALLSIAYENLTRWGTVAEHRSQPYWDAWRRLLDGGFEALLAAMVEDSPRMTELRQSSPFAGVLEPKERWAVYDAYKSGTHHQSSGDHR